jgi:hypothetical protein
MEELVSGFVKSSNAFSLSFSFLRSASAASSFSNLQSQETLKWIDLQVNHHIEIKLLSKLKTDKQLCYFCLLTQWRPIDSISQDPPLSLVVLYHISFAPCQLVGLTNNTAR